MIIKKYCYRYFARLLHKISTIFFRNRLRYYYTGIGLGFLRFELTAFKFRESPEQYHRLECYLDQQRY